MSVGLLTRALILGAAAFAVGVMLLTARRFVREPELVKAKLFLNYGRFSRRFSLIVLFALVAELFTWLYTLAGGTQAEAFETWGDFFRVQALTLLVAFFIGLAMLRLWRMSR